MLGHRGCRLGITYPEIYEMQARAIFEAACEVAKEETGKTVEPEIMIPLVAVREELGDPARTWSTGSATQVMADGEGVEIAYLVGTMIELPRACLRAGEIAKRSRSSSASAPTT